MKKLGQVLMRLGIVAGIAATVTMFRSRPSGSGWYENPALWKLVLVASGGLIAGGVIVMLLAGRQADHV
jgi:hypothetical protein